MSQGTKYSDRASVDRRSFLKMAGFTVGAATLYGCIRGKEREVVPYLVAPEEVVAGRAYWYASVCGACPAACGVLAKALDGRPIKLEGNPDHPLSAGGLCAVGQASVLSLYDSQRLRAPLQGGTKSDWGAVDNALAAALGPLAAGGRAAPGRAAPGRAAPGRVRFLTDSTTGPTERATIEAFLARFPDGRLIIYDPISLSAIADAHEETHGVRVIPRYHVDRAEVIVSFAADFLGNWLSPVEHTRAYRAGRRLDAADAPFSHHTQLESRLTLTGSNADQRVVVPPRSAAAILAHLAERVARGLGATPPWTAALPELPVDSAVVEQIARRLLGAHPGRSLMLCGDNDLAAQRLTNFVNELLGSYAENGTVNLSQPTQQRIGDDRALLELREELRNGNVDALFVRNVNPVYDLPFGAELKMALGEVDLVVSFAEREDETARLAHFVCPEPHFLESWGDSEPAAGIVALRQPVLRVLGKTRPLLESLAVWSGQPATARDVVRQVWRRRVFPRAHNAGGFEKFWHQTLHDGQAEVTPAAGEPEVTAAGALMADAVTLPEAPAKVADGELVVELYASAAAYDGRHAHNPWLLELPDPIAKTTWDNFATLAEATARGLGVENGDELEITRDGDEPLRLPVLVQPGQHPATLSIALGWGRQGTERFAQVGPQWLEGKPTVEEGRLVGTNAAPLVAVAAEHLAYSGNTVQVRPTGVRREFACTQMHHSLFVPERLARAGHERRPIVQETTLASLRRSGHGGHGEGHGEHPSLYKEHEMEPHHWGLVVDLTACTGCSACVISCQAENNIPVVGRDEVSRSREMHWMRIDRYYSGDGHGGGAKDLDVVYMPMMCQHCDNAPCENVCPVQATAQSAEGLNQQVYNRCVGTRYCANNCPYKVRRFNWFDYPREDRLQNMALNPDVTVRSRGVMEKCSMCVQRIQEAKAVAKQAGVAMADGQIEPACAQSCPAGAIVFGDINDPESRLSRLKRDSRHYTVLAELGVKPVVGYLSKVRNRTERSGSDEHS